ncbi:hypothetical protein [Methanobacterium petrolearium]|uniref:hypothetical protein n=1 Tax=Methanobacterium petrolearium TaxID=710190 RepID=UPI001AE8BF7F|nr:hypothetical protein [Methanobacterium petrolearium]MBP1944674.1 hypothetical protein [Methanobacterium petrolearium]BDZ69938.1 hypothetical protein GCM10025861_04550 [Methanobacterium petrolearium]
MKRITIGVDKEVDLKFRKKASQIYNFEKGWYSKAANDAMKSWATESKSITEDIHNLMNSINPNHWETLKHEININKTDPVENIEDFINYINHESNYNLKVEGKNGQMIVELKNAVKSDSNDHLDDLENNLMTLMMLHLIIRIIILSLEEATKDKYVVSGIGSVPPVYINKLKK